MPSDCVLTVPLDAYDIGLDVASAIVANARRSWSDRSIGILSNLSVFARSPHVASQYCLGRQRDRMRCDTSRNSADPGGNAISNGEQTAVTPAPPPGYAEFRDVSHLIRSRWRPKQY